MNKTELVAAVAEQADISKKDAEKALKAFVDVVTEEMKKGEKVQLVGFGTFEVSERAAREGRNPQTGKTMKIEACKAPKFKAGKALKDAVIDTVFSVLYDMLNDPSAYIQIGQDSIPQAVVKNELLGLTFDAIIGVIDAYNNETEHGAIYDPVSWLRNALYKGSQPHIPDG